MKCIVSLDKKKCIVVFDDSTVILSSDARITYIKG
jgi:hypothetical protein